MNFFIPLFVILFAFFWSNNATCLNNNTSAFEFFFFFFSRFLHFMLYKSFELKIVYWFSKEEASLQKWRKIFLKWFFFSDLYNMSCLSYVAFFMLFDVKKGINSHNLRI
jgi:hypothetical protein